MMKGPHKLATAVRKPDGEIELKTSELSSVFKKKFFKLPIIRGTFALIEAMISGVRELMYSASFFEDSIEEDAVDKFLKKVFKDKAENAIIYVSLILALIFSIGVFIIAPSLLTNVLKHVTDSSLILNLVEGIIRVALFVIYIFLISKLDDIKRVFRYHGAEHKTIYCYENGEELIVENVRKYSTLHPRCGTSFIVNVLIISIIVFSFFGWPNPFMRVITRILMLPVIAGLSYEINRYIGGKDKQNVLTKILAYPGLMIQKITTSEPDDSMMEVAIVAMEAVIPENGADDLW
ncbi:DUF1385 domain-containing protein [Sedimentibacter sp. zth1]|uniref:DUF1385 domain-containing protein n=1 Tax=Sedimentibacter sp. zth1 TaxID=2816908 RepID=UPI001A93720B|nr:DUF1385 domain-containing protein [Sedimentibacter sp. zth1]QSX07383.1 DUF1385 domain-containing protein [Sedimentibacter sp. zth1]